MEKQAFDAITPHSTGLDKLLTFLQNNYKDVLNFDATKQFFQRPKL